MEKTIDSLSNQLKKMDAENKDLKKIVNGLEKKLSEERLRRKEAEERTEEMASELQQATNQLSLLRNEKVLIEKKYNATLDLGMDKEMRLKWQEEDEV
jgi:chromosome segregation ATPase